jgi:dihydrofolate reductase
MTINKAWHRAHPMAARATFDQRTAWHVAHANACGCRAMPVSIRKALAAAGRRRLRYGVAVSLDGFIAGTKGEFDWIVIDPAIDFAAMYDEFDTAVMGRHTHEVMKGMSGGHGALPGIADTVVFSRMLPAATHPRVRITNEDPRLVVRELKARPGKDIWLYGGGQLFRCLLDAGLVDTVEVAVIPVILGQGIPLVAPGERTRLVLTDVKRLPESGTVFLSYAIPGGVGPAPRITCIKPRKSVAPRKARAKRR